MQLATLADVEERYDAILKGGVDLEDLSNLEHDRFIRQLANDMTWRWATRDGASEQDLLTYYRIFD